MTKKAVLVEHAGLNLLRLAKMLAGRSPGAVIPVSGGAALDGIAVRTGRRTEQADYPPLTAPRHSVH